MDLASELATVEGRRKFDSQMAGLIRSMSFDELEQVLLDGLRAYPSSFTAACSNTSADQVTISGWDELFADIAAAENSGKQCSAVGIDLSGHGEGDEPALEVAIYDDGSFPFSTASRSEILAKSENYGTPWQGCFVEIGESLQLHGLAQLYGAIRSYEHRHWYQGATLPDNFIGFKLAEWFLYLRVNQAIYRELDRQGLPRPMPIIVGEHDFGPWYVTVYMAERRAGHEAATAQILQRRAEAAKADYDSITDQWIAELVETRSILKHWWWWKNPTKRRNAMGLAEGHEKLLLSGMPVPPAKPTWRMSGKEFVEFVEQFLRWRDPKSLRARLPRVPAERRSMLHETFVKHGIAFGGRWVRMNVTYDRELLRDGQHPLQTGERML